MIRIKVDGVEQLVSSLEGYPENVEVLETDVPRPPTEFHKRVNGSWVVDAPTRDKAKRRAQFEAMSRDELVDWILDQGKAVRDRVAALETKVATLEGKLP